MRTLDLYVLDGYAKDFASWWLQGRHPARALIDKGRAGLKEELYKLTYKDEWDYLVDAISGELGGSSRESFDVMINSLRAAEPRTDVVLAGELATMLAVSPDGVHIGGRVGLAQVGTRIVGMAPVEVETSWSIRRRKARGLPLHVPDRRDRETTMRMVKVVWPVYAGEEDERSAIAAGERAFVQEGLDAVDPLPFPDMVMALNTRISNETAILACDAVVDQLDEGSTAATIRGRTGAQPADPDTAESGTLLFTLTCSDPAFGNAGDANPGGLATAGTITDDSSADATGTLTYCRAGATGGGADDHIDGEAGTSGADFNFNTVSIVSGAVISMTSWTVTMPES